MPWYFAYGSNMQSATLRGRRGVHYEHAVAAVLSGWRLVLDKPSLVRQGHTFANIVPEASAHVYGVAFRISDEDMAHVDLTEGVLIGNYARIEVVVSALSAEWGELAAYTLTSEKRQPEPQPSRRYMGLLVEGAIEHGLPATYVESLRAIPSFEESAEAKEMGAAIETFLRKR